MKNRRFYKTVFAGCLAAAILFCCRADGQAAWEGSLKEEENYMEEAGHPVIIKGEGRSFRAGKSMRVGKPLMAQLSQALVLEQQMELCKDSGEREILFARYKEVLTEAVTGEYKEQENTEGAYGSEKKICIDRRTADYYRDFIHANGESRTAEILREYCEVLEACGYRSCREITEFYEELPQRIEEWGRIEKGDFQYWLWKLGVLPFL